MSADKATHEKALMGMQVGDSFFVGGAKPSDLKGLRRMAYRLGVRISIRWVLQDEIYGESGTRVFRV